MTTINVDQLVNDIKAAASQIIETDIATVKGFSERQLKAIAQQTALVAGGIANGQISEDTREFFLDSIEKMTENFLETLQGLLWLTVEKIWNAVIGVIWKAINGAITATGLVLPVPVRI